MSTDRPFAPTRALISPFRGHVSLHVGPWAPVLSSRMSRHGQQTVSFALRGHSHHWLVELSSNTISQQQACRSDKVCAAPLPPLPMTHYPPGQEEQGEPRGNGAGGKETTRGGRRAGQTALAKTVAEPRRRPRKGQQGKNHLVVQSPCQENYPADTHTSADKSVLESASPAWTRSVHLDAPGQWHGQQPVSGTANRVGVKQDNSSRGSVDATGTRSDPQWVGMRIGERPIGAAKNKQTNTMASCQPPPYGVLWCASQESSTRQHNKSLISGTIGAFRSGRRVAEGAELLPGTELQQCSFREPTENTVSIDTVPLSLLATVKGQTRRHKSYNPSSQQRYMQPPST